MEQVLAAYNKFTAKGGNSADPTGPFSQWAALNRLDEYERAYKAGDKGALLEAISECARAGIVMPDWLVRAYLKAYRRVIHHEARSWDDVFGAAHAKGAHLAALRKQRENSVAVWLAVQTQAKAGTPIDDELFAAVGKKLGLGLTLTKKYYAACKPRMDAGLSAPVKALLDHVKSSRKRTIARQTTNRRRQAKRS